MGNRTTGLDVRRSPEWAYGFPGISPGLKTFSSGQNTLLVKRRNHRNHIIFKWRFHLERIQTKVLNERTGVYLKFLWRTPPHPKVDLIPVYTCLLWLICATRKNDTFHASPFRLLFFVSLPGGAKGRHAKTHQHHHLAGFRVATFRVFASKTRLYDMAQIRHHN